MSNACFGLSSSVVTGWRSPSPKGKVENSHLNLLNMKSRSYGGSTWIGEKKKHVKSIHRKGSLGYALEEHRLESSNTLQSVIEFLSRTWSKSSVKTFHMIAHGFDCELMLKDEAENRERKDCKKKEGQQRPPLMQRSIHSWVDTVKVNQVMKWMKEKLSLINKTERRKEEMKMQAAMSVAGLAAAIAAFSAKSAGDTPDKKKLAIATAAALVAVQCGEVAELMGAQHQHVASILDAAIAVATPKDILALTAAAATTLRGATTGKGKHLREKKGYQNNMLVHSSKDLDFFRNKKILARGSELPICIRNGKTQLKFVQAFAKKSLVILRVRTKHLGGAFTTFKDYTIMEMVDGSKEAAEETCFTNEVNGYCCICIRSSKGDIHITFKDDAECSIWVTTISHILFESKRALLSHTPIDCCP